jgi:hypothetical protein
VSDDAERKKEEYLLHVIEWTNMIETLMKRAISAYFKIGDDDRDFFESHLMNNAVVSFAGKPKVIRAINKRAKLVEKLDGEMFDRLSRLRNVFAHQDPLESVRMLEDDRGFLDIVMVVESMQNNGELKPMHPRRCAVLACSRPVEALSEIA